MSKITFSLCFLAKSLPKAFGKDLTKKQRGKVIFDIFANFRPREGVSAHDIYILNISIDLGFFSEPRSTCVG